MTLASACYSSRHYVSPELPTRIIGVSLVGFSVLCFALALSFALSSRVLLSSALSKRFFCNLILFV